MNIIGHKYIFLSASAVLVLASFVLIAVLGLNLGIDFTGGSLLEIEFMGLRPEVSSIQKVLGDAKFENILVQPSGEKGMILRFRDVSEDEHVRILRALKKTS